MKVLLLAAGRGTRISRYLSGNPKCTVNIGDEKLIQYTIKMLNKKGITDIAMVLGYRADVIKEALKEYNIKFYYNPFFDVTNSIASAWFAKDFICNDYILTKKDSPIMYADGSRKEEADYKFKYKDGILLKYGKELENDDISGEYVGIGQFSKEFISEFNVKLEEMINNQQHSVWWENVIYELSKNQPIKVEDIAGKFWAEVDYIEDYERILKFKGLTLNLDEI